MLDVEFHSGDEIVLRLRVPRLENLVPQESADHLRAAGKETLLSIRALLDRAIDHCDKQAQPGQRRTRIPVE